MKLQFTKNTRCHFMLKQRNFKWHLVTPRVHVLMDRTQVVWPHGTYNCLYTLFVTYFTHFTDAQNY